MACKWVALLALAASANAAVISKSERNPKQLSLFSVVTFPNDQCTSDSTTMGTCLSTTECSDKGGTSSNNCASGFGVCCTFIISASTGGTVKQNCSYITNNGYPTGITTASSTISYTINYVETDICQLRFDFTDLVLPVTSSTGVCLGSFTIDGPALNDPPTVCGTMTGQHMYAEVGTSSTTTSVTVATGTGSTTRTWKVKITQIECGNSAKAPEGCGQYFTGAAGSFKSPGFDGAALLASQELTYCFRQELGRCTITYTVEAASSSPDPFLMTTGTIPANTAAAETISCDRSRINVLNYNGQTTTNTGYFCGTFLSNDNDDTVNGSITQLMAPFQVNLQSTTSTSSSTGFYLNYIQNGC